MTYNNIYAENVKHLYRDVTTTDSVTGESVTTFKAVWSKGGDHVSKGVYADIKKACCNVAVAFADAVNGDCSTIKAIKKAGEPLLKKLVICYFRDTGISTELFSRDCRFIRDFLISTRIDRESHELVKTTSWEKVDRAFQSILYFKLNNLKYPEVRLNNSTSKIYLEVQKKQVETKISDVLASEFRRIDRERADARKQSIADIVKRISAIDKLIDDCQLEIDSIRCDIASYSSEYSGDPALFAGAIDSASKKLDSLYRDLRICKRKKQADVDKLIENAGA